MPVAYTSFLKSNVLQQTILVPTDQLFARLANLSRYNIVDRDSIIVYIFIYNHCRSFKKTFLLQIPLRKFTRTN